MCAPKTSMWEAPPCPHLQDCPALLRPPVSDAHSPPPPTSADSPFPTGFSVYEALLSFVPFGLPFS